VRARSAARRPITAGVAAQAIQQNKRWLGTALDQLHVTDAGAETRDRLGRRRHWRRPIAALGGGGVAAMVPSGRRKRWSDHRRSLAERPLAHLPALPAWRRPHAGCSAALGLPSASAIDVTNLGEPRVCALSRKCARPVFDRVE